MSAHEATGDQASRAWSIDAAVVQRWCRLATEALAANRAAINALNVFPVPDADTGTNLYLTLKSAAEAVANLEEFAAPAPAQPAAVQLERSPAEAAWAWAAVAQGALTGACGNSGIIVSQLLRGLATICAPAHRCDGAVLGAGLAHAAALARESVSRPAPGTVLTVADAAAESAAAYLRDSGTDLAGVAHSAARGARAALSGTTSQLGVLAAAGVVDAGAAGLCVLLDALAAAVGHPVPDAYAVPAPDSAGRATSRWANGTAPPRPDGHPGEAAEATVALEAPESAGYEVTYLLAAEADPVATLRAELGRLGDSVVIVGGTPQWHVHVHLDDAGAAIEAGLRAGGLSRITITWLGLLGGVGAAHGEQLDRPGLSLPPTGSAEEAVADVRADGPAAEDLAVASARPGGTPKASGAAVRRVVVAMGSPGVATLLRGAGAWTVETAGLTDEELAGRVLAEVARVRVGAGGAERAEVVLLPDGDRALGVARVVAGRLTAGSAAAGDGVAVGVVKVAAVLPGLAAMAVQWTGRSLGDDVAAMERAAAGMRHGWVRAEGGSLAALVAGRVLARGTEAGPVALAVVDELLRSAAQDRAAQDRAAQGGPVLDGGVQDGAPVEGAGSDGAASDGARFGGAGPELVTVLVAGAADGELAETVRRHVAGVAPEAEVVCYGGGPAPLLIGVE